MFGLGPRKVIEISRREGSAAKFEVGVSPKDVSKVLAALDGDETSISSQVAVRISRETGISRRAVWMIGNALLDMLRRWD